MSDVDKRNTYIGLIDQFAEHLTIPEEPFISPFPHWRGHIIVRRALNGIRQIISVTVVKALRFFVPKTKFLNRHRNASTSPWRQK